MNRLSAGVKKTINEVKRLADGTIDDQIYACKELLQKKIFPRGELKKGIDTSFVPLLLPAIMKFMESDNQVLQKEAVDAIICLTYTLDNNATEKLVNDTGIVPKLVKFLSSTTDFDFINFILQALVNIAFKYPAVIIENQVLPHIIQYLKSEDKQLLYYAAWLMNNISRHGEQFIPAIFEANGGEPLIKALETKNNDACIKTLKALIPIVSCKFETCQHILNLGALTSLKKLCDRVLIVKKAKRNTLCGSDLSERKLVKLLAIRLIKHVTSYGPNQTDMVIAEGFVPLILQQISDGLTPEIKIEAIETIEIMIDRKSNFLLTLINDNNLFSFYYSNLGSSNADLLLAVLNALKDNIEDFDDKEACRQKIKECGVSTAKLRKLIGHSNEDIRQLAHLINEFVDGDVKSVPVFVRNRENELIELNGDEDTLPTLAETPQTCRQRKRQTNAQTSEGPVTRSKRSRISNEQMGADHSVSAPVNDEDSDKSDDFDDHPGNHSTTVGLDSVRDNSLPRNQSPDIVEIDEKKPLIPRKSSPTSYFDTLTISHNSLDLREVATRIDTMPSPTRSQPIVIQLPVEITDANTNTTAITTTSGYPSVQLPPSTSLQPFPVQITPLAIDVLSSGSNFVPVSYYCPAEFLIRKYCGELGIQFNRKNYATFIKKIELIQISQNSAPATFHSTSDRTGFGCFSMLLIGSEDQSETIRMKINKKFVDDLSQSGNFDEAKITQVIAPPFILKAEHLRTIAGWFNCRIMVYSCGKWEQYGYFNSNDDNTPLFVLSKNTLNGSTHFEIVLSLKNDD